MSTFDLELPPSIELTHLIRERYRFLKYPQTIAEFEDVNNGIAFGLGTWNEIIIDEVRFFRNGILVDTRQSTDNADAVLADLVTLLPEHGLNVTSESVIQRYVSVMVAHLDVDMSACVNPAITALVEAMESRRPTGLGSIGFYTDDNPNLTATRIERLAGAAIAENQYWTQSPLSTERHIEFLREIERVLTP